MTVTLMAQLPGDRPASNPRATRSVVMARRGMIATSQPLASAAGLQVLREGGNAVDAAVTAAAVLSVVEPTMNGIGGDLFAIVYDAKTKQLAGLNASGRAGRAATPEEFRRRGLSSIPERGVLAVTVPGVVDGWSELLARHGTIPLARALRPAIEYARDGFPVPEIMATMWKANEEDSADGHDRRADVPAVGPGTGDRRGVSQCAVGIHVGTDCRGRTRRVLQGVCGGGDCRRHEAARRPDRRTRPCRPPFGLGPADFHQLPGPRRVRAGSQHPGLRGARDAQHPRGVRPEGAGPQLAGRPAPARGGQPNRVRRPARLPRR